MEKDPDKSSPGNSPSGGGDGGDSGDTPPKATTDTVEEDVVVSSSFSVAPVTTVDLTWALSPPESYGKKRGRAEDEGGSSTGGAQKGKKKGELIDPPSTEPKCATCGKTFGSWKAVFGHLRSHPEREYRGAFPPPKIWEEMLRQETARRQHADEGSSGHVEGAAAGLSGRGIEIDLNDPEEPEADKDEFPFDLNMPAPENDEEDDK